MKTAMAILALLVLAAVCGLTHADDHTYVTNKSSRSIRASTTYIGNPGASQFTNRLIAPGTDDSDEYTGFVGTVQVELWVDGAQFHQTVSVSPDTSVVGYDNSDESGVDIYQAAYGTLSQTSGGVLVTISP